MKSCGGPAYAGMQAERSIYMYACRRRRIRIHIKYGTAKETEQILKNATC